MGNVVVLRMVDSKDQDLRELIRLLDDDLQKRYPPEDIFGLDFDDPDIGQVSFAVAYADGIPAGCGALRPIDSTITELKRFFVKEEFRRQGIASRIYRFLEEHARSAGYRAIRLETGPEQPESIALYERMGFTPIDRFGDYVDCEASLCYEKQLGS